jgi:RNA polymerase sigma-70 factor, ECF subfamily
VQPSPVLIVVVATTATSTLPAEPASGREAVPMRGSELSARQERRLVRAAQRGSADAIESLFRAHWARAHRAAYLIAQDASAAEDIAQEAFLAAVRALDRFDLGRPFGPWLHRIVVNRAIDLVRARNLRAEVAAGSSERDRSPELEAPERADELSDRTSAAIAALPADQRAAVVMRYLLEFTPGEIAEVLGLPRGTVNSRLRRGLDSLASELGEGR